MNYEKYINSEEWKNRRQDFLIKHPYCESPLHKGYDIVANEVNHLTYEHIGKEEDDDLQPLCSECHKMIHTNFSFDKNRTIEVGAINEMLTFYYNSRKNKDGVWFLFANKISDKFYDGRKLLNVFDNVTSNFFFQNVLTDILNKGKINELYHLFETEIRNVKSYSKYYKPEEKDDQPKEETPEEKIEEVQDVENAEEKLDDFDTERKYSFSEFMSLTPEEKDEIESHYDLDEGYNPEVDYQVNVSNYKSSEIKSFINKEYMIMFYNCSVYFNREGIATQSTISWFIRNKCSNYLSYLIVTYL